MTGRPAGVRESPGHGVGKATTHWNWSQNRIMVVRLHVTLGPPPWRDTILGGMLFKMALELVKVAWMRSDQGRAVSLKLRDHNPSLTSGHITAQKPRIFRQRALPGTGGSRERGFHLYFLFRRL